jgi:hypothetical protein
MAYSKLYDSDMNLDKKAAIRFTVKKGRITDTEEFLPSDVTVRSGNGVAGWKCVTEVEVCGAKLFLPHSFKTKLYNGTTMKNVAGKILAFCVNYEKGFQFKPLFFSIDSRGEKKTYTIGDNNAIVNQLAENDPTPSNRVSTAWETFVIPRTKNFPHASKLNSVTLDDVVAALKRNGAAKEAASKKRERESDDIDKKSKIPRVGEYLGISLSSELGPTLWEKTGSGSGAVQSKLTPEILNSEKFKALMNKMLGDMVIDPSLSKEKIEEIAHQWGGTISRHDASRVFKHDRLSKNVMSVVVRKDGISVMFRVYEDVDGPPIVQPLEEFVSSWGNRPVLDTFLRAVVPLWVHRYTIPLAHPMFTHECAEKYKSGYRSSVGPDGTQWL